MTKIKKTTVVILIGLGVLIYIFGGLMGNMDVFSTNDIKLMVVANDGLALVSVSPSRGMTSFLKIGPEVMVWVPYDYGFYKAGKIRKLLDYEKKDNLVDKIAFYNFGFFTDRFVYVDKLDNWETWPQLVKTVGLIPTIVLKVKMNDLFFDEYKTDEELVADMELDQILTREFSHSAVIEEGFLVSIYNDSDKNMLASFLAEKLTWLGLNIMAVSDWDRPSVGCQISMGLDVENSETSKYLSSIFNNDQCQFKIDSEIQPNEIEIVLDKTYAQMVNYDSYVRSF